MKPIEPGCLVMVVRMSCEIHRSLLGRVGKAVSQVSGLEEVEVGGIVWASADGTHWEVKFSENYIFHNDGELITVTSVPVYQGNLIRIDGDVDGESQCDEISKVKPISVKITHIQGETR